MIVHIVTEERSDVFLMKALLAPEFDAEHDGLEITWGGGWSSADSLARTLLVVKRAPVVLVVGAESTNPREREEFLRSSLAQVAAGIPYHVTVVAPSLDVLLFKGGAAAATQLLGNLSIEQQIEGRYEPRRVIVDSALPELLQNKGVPFLADPLSDLYQERLHLVDLTVARQDERILQVKGFLNEFGVAAGAGRTVVGAAL